MSFNFFCLIFVLILYCHFFFSVKWFRSSSCSNTHMKSIQKLFGLESVWQAEAEECLCWSEELLFCNTAHVKAVTQLLMSGRLTQTIAAVSWKTLRLWFSVSSIHFFVFFLLHLNIKLALHALHSTQWNPFRNTWVLNWCETEENGLKFIFKLDLLEMSFSTDSWMWSMHALCYFILFFNLFHCLTVKAK